MLCRSDKHKRNICRICETSIPAQRARNQADTWSRRKKRDGLLSVVHVCLRRPSEKAQTKATVRDFPQKPQISKQQHSSTSNSLHSAQREQRKRESVSRLQLQHRHRHTSNNHYSKARGWRVGRWGGVGGMGGLLVLPGAPHTDLRRILRNASRKISLHHGHLY